MPGEVIIAADLFGTNPRAYLDVRRSVALGVETLSADADQTDDHRSVDLNAASNTVNYTLKTGTGFEGRMLSIGVLDDTNTVGFTPGGSDTFMGETGFVQLFDGECVTIQRVGTDWRVR